MGEAFEGRVSVLREARLVWAVRTLWVGCLASFGAALVLPEWGALLIGAGVVLAVLLCAAPALPDELRFRASPAPVRASGEGLAIDGRLVAPKGSIAEGLVLPRPAGAPLVRIVSRGLLGRRAIELVVADEAEGRRLLAALGLDASRRAARFRLLPRFEASSTLGCVALALLLPPLLVVLIAGLLLALFGYWAKLGLLLLAASVAFVPALAWGGRPRELLVGKDGVLLPGALRRRFLPYVRIRDVLPLADGERRGARIEVEDGGVVDLPLARGPRRPEESDLLVARLEEGLASARRSGEASAEALRRRPGEPARTWVERLRGAAAGGASGHRSAALSPEALLEAAESQSVSPALRLAAALALGAKAEPALRERLRIEAEASVSPAMRRALTRAAEGTTNDAELELLLEEVDASARR